MDNVWGLVNTQFNVRPYIFHSFLFPSLKYSQLHRHLLCIASLVWLILLVLYLQFLTITWTAILICLEHSFWLVQHGHNSNDGFTKAWKFYLKTQHALAGYELDVYLKSKGINDSDWFMSKYHPSEKECVECRKIILNNLLRKSSPVFFELEMLIPYHIFSTS